LAGEERQAAAKDDPADLPFRAAFPNMNISPPMTIETSASDRASGPVKVDSRFVAARSHGLCA